MGKKIQCIGRYTMEGLTLGKGTFARVELAHHTVTEAKVAIKIIDRSKLKDNQKDHLHREARILGQLRHPNIVRLYETLKATTLHCLVLELAAGGELQNYIRCHKDGRLPEEKSRPFVRQMVSALHYLHERGVAHRDLKMENVMLDEKRKHVKLVDFGLSITFTKDELMKTHCGSPEYAAPELSAGNDRYGPEIDVWSLGIVMYAMLVGHLPFTTPYTDHYKRQKLVQQMEKGLVETHNQQIAFLSQDAQHLLRKVIEPSPEQRISLLDMEVHSWITNSGKLPFFPFQAFPRDKTMRTQGSPSLRQQMAQESLCMTDEEETIMELSEKLKMKKEHMEQKVGETKSDETSAMFNMMLDCKRREQGLYDFDHTSKPIERREPKARRRAKSAPDDKKGRVKGKSGAAPPALVLPAQDASAESGPHSGNEATAEPETRMTSFDFLALCSTPSWLGPERRRSRRRGGPHNPSSHHKNTEGMSVRSQLRRDYLERQGIEATHAAVARDEPHHSSSHHNHVQHHHRHHSGHGAHAGTGAHGQASNLLSPPTTASNLSVPDCDGAHSCLHRYPSLKLSRKRARSFGPGQRKRSAFQRSGSVDTPMQANTEKGEHGKLHYAKSDTLATNSPSTLSMAAASLAVAFGGQTPHVLTLQVPGAKSSPVPRPANLTLKECYSLNLSNTPKFSSSLNPSKSVQDSVPCTAAEKKERTGKGPVTSVEVHVSDSISPCPPVPNTMIEASSCDALGAVAGAESKLSVGVDKLEVPSTSEQTRSVNKSWSTESLPGNTEVKVLSSADQLDHADSAAEGTSHLLRPLDLMDCNQRPVFHQQVPPHTLSLHRDRPQVQEGEKGATAMQLDIPKAPLSFGAPGLRLPDSRHVVDSVRGEKRTEEVRGGLCTSLDSSMRALTLDGLIGATGISGSFNDDEYDDEEDGLENEVEVVTEDEDVVFTTDSDHVQRFLATLPKNKAVNEIAASTLQHELPSPDELEEDLLQMRTGLASESATDLPHPLHHKKRGSTGSHSHASSSGSKSQMRGSVPLQGGKLKTPTTPLSWMVLRSPLARIESFHSDDFEYYNSSDTELPAEHASVASASPMSASTPTVPCFAYRLNMTRKKPPKLKKGTRNNNAIGKAGNKSAVIDKGSLVHPCDEPAVTDPLLSSGSDTEHVDDVGDRLTITSKAKVHREDKDGDKQLLKTGNKCTMYNNAITQQPNRQAQQNCVSKVSKNTSTLTVEVKKKSGPKNSPWKRSFAQFLKRKRQGPRCHNNNNDCASSPVLPANHNGCSPSSPVTKVESNNIQTSLTTKVVINTTDIVADITAETGNCKQRVYVPATENNIAEGVESQTNPHAPPASPDTGGVGVRVFDFTLLNDSPKGRPCLLSWHPCGHCVASDLSSDDENECSLNPVVTMELKSLEHGHSSLQDIIQHSPGRACPSALHCTQT